MRNLQTSDIFEACRVVKQLDLKDELLKAVRIAQEDGKKDRTAVGFDIIYTIFEKATEVKGEKALYTFISKLFECKPSEVEVMDPVEMLDKLVEVASIEKWKAFFSRVAALIARN